MVNIASLLAKAGSGVGFSFGVRAWTEVEIRCIKGMHRLKLILSEKYSGFKRVKISLSVFVVKLYGFCSSIAYIARRNHPYIDSLPTLC